MSLAPIDRRHQSRDRPGVGPSLACGVDGPPVSRDLRSVCRTDCPVKLRPDSTTRQTGVACHRMRARHQALLIRPLASSTSATASVCLKDSSPLLPRFMPNKARSSARKSNTQNFTLGRSPKSAASESSPAVSSSCTASPPRHDIDLNGCAGQAAHRLCFPRHERHAKWNKEVGFPRMKLKYITLGFVAVGSLTFFSVSYLTIPRRVARLVGDLCRPEPGMSCYDPCCGSGRLPRAVQNAVIRPLGDRMQIGAQEINPIPFLAAVANRRLHHLNMNVKRGSSLHHPAFTVEGGKLKRFDLAVANPMWNQSISAAVYRSDRFERFCYGWPSDSGDWVWMQHLLAHLGDNGRMVVCLDCEAMSRCDDPAEVDIRRSFVEADLIEAVIRCPWEISRPRWLVRSNILNTPRAALVVVNKNKKRSGEILFVNSRPLVQDYLDGNLKSDVVHHSIMNAVCNWATVSGMVEIISNADVAKIGYILAPELHCANPSMSSCYRRRGAAKSFMS